MPDIIDKLRATIAEAQATLAELEAAPRLTAEGWLAHKPNLREPNTQFAPRHGCAWNETEQRDLLRGYLAGQSLENLAIKHRRTASSLRSELQRLLGDVHPMNLGDFISACIAARGLR